MATSIPSRLLSGHRDKVYSRAIELKRYLHSFSNTNKILGKMYAQQIGLNAVYHSKNPGL